MQACSLAPQALSRMLAAPPNARIQVIVPSHSICGRSSLLPTLSKTKRTLRAGNGPTIVQGGLLAPKGSPPPPRDPFYNRVTELDYFKEKFRGEVGFVTVLVGPRNCGKSVSSAFLCWSAVVSWYGSGNRDMFFSFLFLLNSFNYSSYTGFLFIISCRDC